MNYLQKLAQISRIILLIIFSFFLFSCDQIQGSAQNVTGVKNSNELLEQISNLNKLSPDSGLHQALILLNDETVIKDAQLYNTLIEQFAILKAYSGDVDSSLYFFNKAFSYWQTDTSAIGKEHYGSVLNNIGYTYFSKGDLDKAIEIFEKALDYSTKTNNLNLEINSHLNLSDIYQGLGQYGKALDHIERCIKLCSENSDSVKMVSTLNAYATLYSNCHLFDEAEEQFNELQKFSKHYSPYMEFNFYNNKGRMYYLKEDYTQAKKEFLHGLSIVNRDDSYSYMIILSNLAETYLFLKNSDTAKVYLDLLAQMDVGMSTMPIFNFNYNSLLGEYFCQEKDYAKAKNAFETADFISATIDVDKVLQKLHTQRKSRFFFKTKNYKEASSQLQDFIRLNDAILQEDNLKQVAGLKYKFQRDTTIISQRNNIIINQQQIKTYKYQQWLYIICIVVLLLLVGFIILFFRKVRTLNHEINIRKIAALKMESIRGRISPHFAFNVLNNIWAISDDKENAKAQFDNLMNMIRQSLVNTEKMSIPLGEEIEFVKSFIDLQNLRMDNDLDVEWNIEQLVGLQQHVPGMILQIPVENAIKHGLSSKLGEKKLRIDIGVSSGSLNLVITDNGVGYHPALIATQGTGTGLKVLTQTLHLLNEVNTAKMKYEIINLSGEGKEGTRVNIKIPNNFHYNLS